MNSGDTVRVRYTEDSAEVWIGERLLQVQRRDNDARTYTCPIELVAASLGS
jgi:hypothetical protein